MKVLKKMFDSNAFSLLFVLTLHVVGCECNYRGNNYTKDLSFADQICPLDQVLFQKVARSAVECGRKCSGTPGCTSLIYLHDNMTCLGIKSFNPFYVSLSLQGSVFYKPKVIPGTPMVVGLPDSQFNASSVYSSTYEPWAAKFSSDKPWAPIILDTEQWLQVDFPYQILATHVITKGYPVTLAHFVTSYKVLTSNDCTTFVTVKDAIGNDKIFLGNTDRDTPVQNALEPPVVCRCLRINPWTWNEHTCMQLEVLGHVV